METALIVVDVQNDFCPGGALGIDGGDKVIEPANRLVRLFERRGWPIYFTRDWHPEDHCSFKQNGGIWPPHCIAGTPGAQFHPGLHVPAHVEIVSKATESGKEAYSTFEGTDLADRLRKRGVAEIVMAGLATDYCVKNSAFDAHRLGFGITVASDAVCAVNLMPDDGRRAIMQMQRLGATFAESAAIIKKLSSQ